MSTISSHENALAELREKVEFYEEILDKLPALIYINELDENGSINSFRNIWMNKRASNLLGLTQEEITQMGINFVKNYIHPNDQIIVPKSIELHYGEERDSFYTGIYRIKGKYQEEYKWLFGYSYTFKSHPNGAPKQSLNINLEITNSIHSEDQMIKVLKDVNRLKHALKLKSLTRRENEILKLIAKGKTNKEVSDKLNISEATAKTHRNKILKKLELKNSAALAAFATECGV
jgi:DNA-binding CsgD family transcriptional regulator